MVINQFVREFNIDHNYVHLSLQDFIEKQFSWVIRDGWVYGTHTVTCESENDGKYSSRDIFTVALKEENSLHTLIVKVWKHPQYVDGHLAAIDYSWVHTQKEGNPKIHELYSVELMDGIDNAFLDRILSKVYSLRDKLYP